MKKSYWNTMSVVLFSAAALFPAAESIGSDNIEFFRIDTPAPSNRRLEFAYRLPKGRGGAAANAPRVMVLFGGRNWKGADTIKRYGFNALADEYNLVLLSPSFKDDEYWRPEKWSGAALLKALKRLRERYGARIGEVLSYGYSAGGQCATLFHHWRPAMVAAWGAHACGVYERWESERAQALSAVPFLLTCGEEDRGRYHLSLAFLQSARRMGAMSLWRAYSQTGHELNPAALDLAKAFFSAYLRRSGKVEFSADEQTGRIFKAGSRQAKEIDPEDRGTIFDSAVLAAWRKR